MSNKPWMYASLNQDEGVLMNMNTKDYFRLNGSAKLIWEGLTAGDSAEVIEHHILSQYDGADSEQVRADIQAFVQELDARGFSDISTS